MNKWPLKMWLWPEQEIAYGSWVENDPRLIQVHVLPEAPEPVRFQDWFSANERRFHTGHFSTEEIARAAWNAASHPSTIRQEERERCAKLAEQHFIPGHSVAGPHFAAQLAAAIRALKEGEG